MSHAADHVLCLHMERRMCALKENYLALYSAHVSLKGRLKHTLANHRAEPQSNHLGKSERDLHPAVRPQHL